MCDEELAAFARGFPGQDHAEQEFERHRFVRPPGASDGRLRAMSAHYRASRDDAFHHADLVSRLGLLSGEESARFLRFLNEDKPCGK